MALVTALSGLVALAGCSRSSDPAAANSASAPMAIVAAATGVQPGGDSGRGDGYEFAIQYPPTPTPWSALENAMHAYGEQAKKNLLADREKSPVAGRAISHLQLNFTVATQTSDFVSAIASGGVSRGDGPATPMLASFTVHLSNNSLVSLVDLFTDPDASRKVLGDETRRQLGARFEANLHDATPEGRVLDAQLKRMREWVDNNTAPIASNFHVFLVDGVGGGSAIGLTLIFPRDATESWMESDPQVEVPSQVFYMLLKPEYRAAFSIDPQDLKRLQAAAG